MRVDLVETLSRSPTEHSQSRLVPIILVDHTQSFAGSANCALRHGPMSTPAMSREARQDARNDRIEPLRESGRKIFKSLTISGDQTETRRVGTITKIDKLPSFKETPRIFKLHEDLNGTVKNCFQYLDRGWMGMRIENFA